jgi:hypothetical protein
MEYLNILIKQEIKGKIANEVEKPFRCDICATKRTFNGNYSKTSLHLKV